MENIYFHSFLRYLLVCKVQSSFRIFGLLTFKEIQYPYWLISYNIATQYLLFLQNLSFSQNTSNQLHSAPSTKLLFWCKNAGNSNSPSKRTQTGPKTQLPPLQHISVARVQTIQRSPNGVRASYAPREFHFKKKTNESIVLHMGSFAINQLIIVAEGTHHTERERASEPSQGLRGRVSSPRDTWRGPWSPGRSAGRGISSSPRRARRGRAWRSPGASVCSCRTAGSPGCAGTACATAAPAGSSRCPGDAACAPPLGCGRVFFFCLHARVFLESLRCFFFGGNIWERVFSQ